jgi:hypothetical protein
LGLTAQIPKYKSYKQDPQEINRYLNETFGVRRELRLMQVKQNSFSPSRILFTLGAGSDLS